MRLSQLVETSKPIPVKRTAADEQVRNDSDGALVTALHRAKRACRAAVQGQPLLFRGTKSFKPFADHVYYLPNEYALYEFSGRTTPRNSATGRNLIQSLTKVHPEWKAAGMPSRELSTFCANQADDAGDFGQLGIVLPFDRVVNFGVTEDDLNLKNVHTNNGGAHHLLKMQNTVALFILEMKDIIKNFHALDDIQIQSWSEGSTRESTKQIRKRLADIPLIMALNKHEKWLETAAQASKSWTPDDLKIVDELYDARLKSRNVQFVQNQMSQQVSDRMFAVFQNEKVSDVLLYSMRPKNLGAVACDYEQMLNEIRTSKLREIWFEGPFFVLANFGFEEISGYSIARFLRQDPFMQRIMTKVTG